MLETWAPVELILGFVIVVALGAPVIYAWADRWIDRTRNKISDAVDSTCDDDKGGD